MRGERWTREIWGRDTRLVQYNCKRNKKHCVTKKNNLGFVYFQLLETHNESLKPSSSVGDDKRLCTLCGETGDGDNNASAR